MSLELIAQTLEEQYAICRKAEQFIIDTRERFLARIGPIEEQIRYHTAQINIIRNEMETDPYVIAAETAMEISATDLATMKTLAEEVCGQLWEDGALSTKTTRIGGCTFKIKEVTKRTVVDQEAMAAGARENGVYDKVIKGAKYTMNRKAWNA